MCLSTSDSAYEIIIYINEVTVFFKYIHSSKQRKTRQGMRKTCLNVKIEAFFLVANGYNSDHVAPFN